MKTTTLGAKIVMSVTLGIAAAFPQLAQASDTWPSQPMRWILPFPPGNGADVVSRLIADKIAQETGQPVVVQNLPGGGGTIGIESFIRQAPDGHTFTVASVSPITVLPAVSSSLRYDPMTQLAPVALLAGGPNVIIANNDFPVKSIADLGDYCRKNPGKATISSLGYGTASHITSRVIAKTLGCDLIEVPYKGSSQALADLMGGHVNLQNDSLQSTLSQIKSGNVTPLAVTSLNRSSLLPDVPSVSEMVKGLENFQYEGWIGVFAQRGMSPDNIERMNRILLKAIQEPDVQKALTSISLTPASPNTADEFRQFVARDFEKWKTLSNEHDIKVN